MDINEYALEWFTFADMDLAAAEHLISMYPQPLEIICYYCQQSAEKYLKGFLFYKGEKPPKTHEVDKLCDMCSAFDSRFDEIYDECAALTQYGVQPRYPYEINIDEYHMNQALTFSKAIRDFDLLNDLHEKLKLIGSVKEDPSTDKPTI